MSLPVILSLIIGILCLLYGIMVLMVRSGTMFFAVWLMLGGFFVLLGFLLQVRFFDKIPPALRLLFAGGGVLAVLYAMICAGFVLRGFGSHAPDGLDYLIVLGAQVREDGPSAVLRYRLDAAADYMEKNADTICIVSGGKGHNEPYAEGTAMKEYLAAKGIDPARILVEDRSHNTVQNIQFSKKLMASPDAPTAIVTNNFHVTRAMALARKQGLTNVFAIAAPSDLLFLPNNVFREFFGLAKDFAAGNL